MTADEGERLDTILALCLDEDAGTWELEPDGRWTRRRGRFDVQERLAEEARARHEANA